MAAHYWYQSLEKALNLDRSTNHQQLVQLSTHTHTQIKKKKKEEQLKKSSPKSKILGLASTKIENIRSNFHP